MSALPNPVFRSDLRARKLVSEIPTTTARSFYQCPSTKTCEIKSIVITNIHSGSTTVTLYHLRPSETVSTRNALYYEVTVSKNAVLQDTGPYYLGPGDSLWILCSTGNHVTVTLYGIEE